MKMYQGIGRKVHRGIGIKACRGIGLNVYLGDVVDSQPVLAEAEPSEIVKPLQEKILQGPTDASCRMLQTPNVP